jgi:hypothetical protein
MLRITLDKKQQILLDNGAAQVLGAFTVRETVTVRNLSSILFLNPPATYKLNQQCSGNHLHTTQDNVDNITVVIVCHYTNYGTDLLVGARPCRRPRFEEAYPQGLADCQFPGALLAVPACLHHQPQTV